MTTLYLSLQTPVRFNPTTETSTSGWLSATWHLVSKWYVNNLNILSVFQIDHSLYMVSLYCSRKYIRRDEISILAALGRFPSWEHLNELEQEVQAAWMKLQFWQSYTIENSKVLKKLERQLNGFKYSNFDFYTSHSERINHPTEYGMFLSTCQFRISCLCFSNNKSILTVKFRVWLVSNPSIPILGFNCCNLNVKILRR